MLDYDDEFSTTMHNDIAIQQLNSILPKDIRAFSCNGNILEYHEIDVRVSNGFNPHLNSFSRKYLYYLPIDLYHCIFFLVIILFILAMNVPIDESLFIHTIQQFQGTHSMKNYTGSIQ